MKVKSFPINGSLTPKNCGFMRHYSRANIPWSIQITHITYDIAPRIGVSFGTSLIVHSDIKLSLIPPDPESNHAVILEIRPGTGGEEASLFARDLVLMYQAYSKQRFKFF